MNKKILQDIGLTDGETRVYLALLKLGSSTSGPITDEAKVSRSKVYHILDRLIKKGLVSYIIKDKTKYYQAEDPIKIQDYLDEKEKEFEKRRIEINKIIPQLQLQKKMGKKPAEAQIYKGFKGVQTVIDHTYLRLKKGEYYYNVGIPAYQDEKYEKYWHKDHKKRVKLGIKCKLLFNAGTPRKVIENRNSYWGCDARYMSFPIETPAWFLVYKDVAVVILQSEEGMAIEIINQEIADSFKKYFDTFWKMSKKFK